jgi:hypothetical protein
VGKPEGKRPLGRPRRRWAGNIEMDLREIGWDGLDWIDMALDTDQWGALVNTVYIYICLVCESEAVLCSSATLVPG